MHKTFQQVGLGLLVALVSSGPAQAFSLGGKLPLTGGVTQVEGAAGGGLTPWAVIGGNGTADQVGGTAFYTRVNLSDYHLDSYGVLIGIRDRVELSLSQQRFDTGAPGVVVRTLLGAPTTGAFALQQDIYGLKVRVLGEAVLDQDTWMPQVAVGIQRKVDNDSTAAVAKAVGAQSGKGTDIYVSATKLWLAHSLLANVTLRATKANQFGLLGFGGDKNSAYRAQFEGSLAYLFRNNWVAGLELRTKPDNLDMSLGGERVLAENLAFDVFTAYALSKNTTVTAAYVDLGKIVSVASKAAGGSEQQRGAYLSVQFGF